MKKPPPPIPPKARKITDYKNKIITLKTIIMSRKFKHGTPVVDKITGFKGIVTAFSDFITGCDQYCVQPAAVKGEYKEALWFDEGKLELDTKGKTIEPITVQGKENGCDQSAPVKN